MTYKIDELFLKELDDLFEYRAQCALDLTFYGRVDDMIYFKIMNEMFNGLLDRRNIDV